ncbi:serine/arginine repetitive matrix protein 2 [Anoplophora glabripennis]|nr:serine/arginine repetitive matrix protein 2 [Anoplophora glabripennis]
MSSDDSDAEPHHKRKRKVHRLEDSPESTSSSGSPVIGSSSSRRRRGFHDKNPIRDSSDSESDSGSSIHRHNKRKKVRRVASDSDSESSGSTVVKRTKKASRIVSDSDADSEVSDRGFEGSSSSQWETDFSDIDLDMKVKPEAAVSSAAQDNNIDSDSSDGQSEKCPICLISFKVQEIGTPESCDHMFCLECIQEWSKNMNTCPVDRQEYNLILVRKNISGKVIRQVPIEKPAPQNDVDIVEDPTFCEICGSSDNEDQMLLCDGCDLGFHLYCLTPPLDEVPGGAWYCNYCSPDDDYTSEVELYEIQLMMDGPNRMQRPQGQRRNQSARLVPRTRQTERVRRRIADNRQQNHRNGSRANGPSTSSLEDSQLVNSVTSSTSRVKRSVKHKKSKRKPKKQVRYTTVYEIDEATGETVAVTKRQKKYKKRKKRYLRTTRSLVRSKTVKKRLAAQLGICAPRTVPQNLPDVKIQSSSNTLGGLRYQAGIPPLHLFGQNNQLDYFSGEEDENFVGGSGVQLLSARAPNRSDISAMRRMARRKAAINLTSAVSSSTDLLDSILSSQEQFHSRNSAFSVDSSGRFMIEKKSRNNYVDVKAQPVKMRQRPNNYHQGGSNPNPNYNRSNPNNYHSHSLYQYHSTPTSTMESTSTSGFSGGDLNEVPQDYTQRTLCASSEANTQERKDKDDDNTGTNTPNSESEIDIYSDIETVSTSKIDESDLRTTSPPLMIPNVHIPNMGTDEYDDNNDSEPDMVIDDEKMQEADRCHGDQKEETAVTSTVGFSSEFAPAVVESAPEMPHSSMEIQSGAIQSSNLMDGKNIEDDDDWTDGCPNTSIYSKEGMEASKENEDVDSDDGCPNFSIYSKESKSLALHTDISLSAEDNVQMGQDYQVGEVSSSPNVGISDNIQENEGENVVYDFEREAVQENFPPEENAEENVTYEFEKDSTFPQETSEGNVIYEFERSVVKESVEENVTYEFEKTTDTTDIQDEGNHSVSNPPNPVVRSRVGIVKKLVSGGILGGLYSDSEDESMVKKDGSSFAISDINHMTEDISEEERSYTPCLDERGNRQGLEGLDTELISDEDRNDFDESHELKTVSDGDALEINAKESELDFTRPEDYEEGEIVDKNKGAKKSEEAEKKKVKGKTSAEESKDGKKPKKKEKEKQPADSDKGGNKENEGQNKEASFKKLSKNSKERNYRDKDADRPSGTSKAKEDRLQNRKDKRREKRKELERYNVRAIIAEKPRPFVIKDQFGRDIRRTPSRSKSKSNTPPIQDSPPKAGTSPSKTRQRSLSKRRSRSLSRRRSASRGRNSVSKERSRKRRPRSRNRSVSRSKSRSPRKKRSGSKTKKRKRSNSRYKRRKSRERSKKKPRNRSRNRSMSPSRRNREWNNRRGWTPLSVSPPPEVRHVSPSWTPPRIIDTSHLLNIESLTAAMNANKKKKEKKRKGDKRIKENTATIRQKKRRRERERTPPPSKEVFASGDNILVSVSFNNENETRDVTTRERRKKDMEDMNRKKKERRRNKNRRDLSGIKPVAIIDLERSPFKEITPSPKDVIVLTDSDNNDNEEVSRSVQNNICDSSQQVASPERSINYSMGPKTPPEPQIKFSLSAKPPQVRAINNPLHDPDDMENNDDVQEEINSRINETLHKGPNTPPEPPNSPPSSPDVYDPFEPTKSRSPTPDPLQTVQSNLSLNESTLESRAAIELLEKSINPTNPDLMKSLTPPIADVQPADSQSSIQATPESNVGKSPERISVVINQTVQPSMSTSKPVAQTTPFSSVPTSLITSTPVSSNLAPSRINILNSTIITPPHVASSVPQRIILPNQVKSSPVKILPTKATIKSTPIKPMPNKNNKSTAGRKNWAQNGSGEDLNLDFDSPYSPGSSDYEDLFEPPPENISKSTTKSTNKSNAKSPQKHQSVFDALFGSPSYNKSKTRNDKKFGKKSLSSGKTKTVGVKLDEDNLKILDELPNSAVEMQVKDKFLKKLNRQERVVEEVKLVLKPHYNKKRINKEEYKDILRRSVPKICHNKSGEINPTKIKNLIEAYVKKIRHSKKVTSSSSINPQKV